MNGKKYTEQELISMDLDQYKVLLSNGLVKISHGFYTIAEMDKPQETVYSDEPHIWSAEFLRQT